MSLMYKVKQPDAQGRIQHITPESAGWRYVGFSAYQLKRGQSLTLASGDKELCLVLVAGLASVRTRQVEFANIGKRLSPFERTPPYSVYVPPDEQVDVLAESDLELAVCSAPGAAGKLPARLIAPQDVGVEPRGKGTINVWCTISCQTISQHTACWLWRCIPMKATPVPGQAINTTAKIHSRKPVWKRLTIIVSNRKVVSPCSVSILTTVRLMSAWRPVTVMW